MFCSFALRVFVFHLFTNADKAEKVNSLETVFPLLYGFCARGIFLKSTRKILVSELSCMFTLLAIHDLVSFSDMTSYFKSSVELKLVEGQ